MNKTRMLLSTLAILAAVPGTASASSTSPIFAAGCPLSHRASDDPIVFPGQRGASHSHDFSGNWTTRFDSDYESLRRAAELGPGTTCNQQADTGAYWTPTLYDASGRPIDPVSVTAYYVPGKKKDLSAIQAPPAGLKIIADMSTGAPHGSGWHCGDAKPPQKGGSRSTTTIPSCAGRADGPGGIFPDDTRLQAKVVFPDCWDGANLDSSDHRSHMAYAISGGVCPSTHPVAVPRINMKVKYDTFGGSGFSIASGDPKTYHADFLNSWDQAELEQRVEVCIRRVVDSSTHPCREPGNPVTVANPAFPDASPPPSTESEPGEGSCGEPVSAPAAARSAGMLPAWPAVRTLLTDLRSTATPS